MAQDPTRRPRPQRRRAILPASLLVAVLVVGATVVLAGQESTRLVGARDALGQVADCRAQVDEFADARTSLGWPHVQDAARVHCPEEHVDLPEGITYAAFSDRITMRADLLAHPSPSPICLDEPAVYLNGVDIDLGRLCRAVGGTVVDEVSQLPETPSDGTGGSMDRELHEQNARDARVQGQALAARWAERQ